MSSRTIESTPRPHCGSRIAPLTLIPLRSVCPSLPRPLHISRRGRCLVSTIMSTYITLTSRPVSLPLLRPSSPLILPSESPSEVITRWTHESDYSPISTPTLSSIDHTTPHVYTARIASRATADLVHILDLSLPAEAPSAMEKHQQMIGRPVLVPSHRHDEHHGRQGEAAHKSNGGVIPFENPRTPPKPPMIPLPHSPTSPLTRENMARLKQANKISPSDESHSPRAPPITQQSHPPEQSQKLAQPARRPLGSPVKLGRTPASPVDIASEEAQAGADTFRWTMTTESSIFSINTDNFSMPKGNGPARSDTYQWPLHGPRSRAAMENDSASITKFVFPSPPSQLITSPEEGKALQQSFMSLDGTGTTSTTYNFPPSAPPTISRMSIASDASSAYAPSMAAPSSVARRTAAWTQGGLKTETVFEEVSPST